MDLITVRDLFKNTEKYAGVEVNVGGWVRNRRGSKQFGFIVLNDGTYFTPVQVVYNDTLENFQEISKINIGAALIIRGTLVLTPDSKQPFEIQAESITVEGPSTGDYPLQPKRHSMEFLRTINHLRPRTNTFQAVFRVRSLAAMAIHQFFQDRDFVYVHTPLITGSDCEGAGEMFQVTTLDLNNVPKTEDGKVDYTQDFFGKPTNLTVSGQLNGETFAMAFRNIYTFGPTFRAENSNTTRHAAEFWMIEPEIAFADLEDDMELAEDMIKYIISYVLEHAPEEMNFFNEFIDKGLLDRLHNVLHNEFGRITYTDAVALLEKHNNEFEYPVHWGSDLQTEHERFLTEKVFKKPVFVTDYPKEIKAFYMKLNPDGKTVAAMDCLVPGIGEIIGGSQREERLDLLLGNSSVMHMGYIFLAFAALIVSGSAEANPWAVKGAALLMLAHGLSIALLFMLCGQIEKQTGTLEINSLGGLGTRLPRMAFVFGLAGMASIGLPGLANFPGEFMVFFSGFAGFENGFGPVQFATILCLWGLVIGAVYMLRAYRNIFQGDLSKAAAYATELLPAERAANYFLVITLVVFGFLPDLVLQFFS